MDEYFFVFLGDHGLECESCVIWLDNFTADEIEQLAIIRRRVKKDVESVRLQNQYLKRLLLAARNLLPVSHDTAELIKQIDAELRVNRI